MTSTTNKTISNTKFDMIVPGMYFSEDKKGVIINVFVFTKMYGNSDKDAVSAELNKCLDENAPEFKDSVECLIFKTGELGKFWEKGSILVDADKAVSVFSNLKTIVFSDEIKINNAPDSIRLIGRYELEDAGYSEEKNGDMEKAEYYYRWVEEIDTFWGHLYLGELYMKQGNTAAAEEHLKSISGKEQNLMDEDVIRYGRFLAYRGRFKEALEYFHNGSHRVADSVENGVVSTISDFLTDGNCWEYLSVYEFDGFMHEFFENLKNGNNFENILLKRTESDDEEISSHAKHALMNLYLFGECQFWWDCNGVKLEQYTNFEKALAYKSQAVKSIDDLYECIREMVERGFGANQIEAFLLTNSSENDVKILLNLYREGKHTFKFLYDVEVPELKNEEKAAEFAQQHDIPPIEQD